MSIPITGEHFTAEKAAMETKLAESGPENRPLRKHRTTLLAPLPLLIRKPRKKASPEELEERRKKVYVMTEAIGMAAR